MGKLRDLWEAYRETDKKDPYKKELQKQINDVETWMIGKGLRKNITQWTDAEGMSNRYPHHVDSIWYEDIHMIGQLNGKGIHYNPDGSIHVCPECGK